MFMMAVIGMALSACTESGQQTTLPASDYNDFEGSPYTVLLRDCGFPTCHGTQERFFRVFGPGRTRLVGSREVSALDQRRLQEVLQTQLSADAMLNMDDLENSPILRKPLAVAAGGAGHEGVDAFGRDVYRTRQDPGYVTLRDWVLSLRPPEAPVVPAAAAPTTQ